MDTSCQITALWGCIDRCVQKITLCKLLFWFCFIVGLIVALYVCLQASCE